MNYGRRTECAPRSAVPLLRLRVKDGLHKPHLPWSCARASTGDGDDLGGDREVHTAYGVPTMFIMIMVISSSQIRFLQPQDRDNGRSRAPSS